jgi:spermidine dehydrogenase
MNEKQSDDSVAPCADLTRRDFIGTTLLGAGAALLSAPCPAAARELGRSWTGYGGVGDYRSSNGNTADVVRSAHRIRDGEYAQGLRGVSETGESYDAVIVGAGFAGMAALYEFRKARPNGTCLVLDNHPIFGGEAKQNEFDVDGYRLVGPQGSNSFSARLHLARELDPALPEAYRLGYHYWRELGLPEHFEFASPTGTQKAIAFGKDNFDGMYSDTAATVGYFFQNELTGGKPLWVNNIWSDDLQRAPMPEHVKQGLLKWRDYQPPEHASEQARETWARRLDSMTLAQFVTGELGLSADILPYADAGLAAGVFAATTDGLSAFATEGSGWVGLREHFHDISFPGGNTALLRHFVKAVFPDAIEGPKAFAAIANNAVNLAVLDRPDSKLRMRLKSTVVGVMHRGDPRSAEQVDVTYERGGQLYRVKARGVVLAIGSWVARHIARDVPLDYQDALARIPHGPILSVNVALRNWRFLDRLGVSAARWFDGFGFFANVRHPMQVGDRPTVLDPAKPAVLTFYVPFLRPGLPVEAQGPVGRAELYGTSYAEFERKIITQMQRLFAGAGFDARRDLAGIVINRWGHALFSPPPGFFFGKDGKPSPLTVLRERFGRIAFGHSELSGTLQSWETAAAQGKRAIGQVLEVL